MTENAAKKELWSYMNSKKLEERKLEQIEEQKIKLTKVTSVLSDMPKGTPDNHKLDTNIVYNPQINIQIANIMLYIHIFELIVFNFKAKLNLIILL